MVSTEINEFCILLFVATSSLQNFFLESKSWSGICLAASFWYILYEHFGIDREGRSSHSSRFSYFRKRKRKNTRLDVCFETYRVLLPEISWCISRFGYPLKECRSYWGVERWWSMRFLLPFWISWFFWIWIPKVVWLYHQRKLRNDDCKCMWPKGTSFSGFIVEQAWQLYFMKQEHLMLLYLLPYVSIFLIWMKADAVKNDFVWVQITEISPWKKWHLASPNHNIYFFIFWRYLYTFHLHSSSLRCCRSIQFVENVSFFLDNNQLWFSSKLIFVFKNKH